MKPRILVPVAALLAGLAWAAVSVAQAPAPAAQTAPTEHYELDPVHSTVIFRVVHMGVSPFYGRINAPTGSFDFNPDDPSQCAFAITLETKNVDTNNARRDGHLKSVDFFNAKEFPRVEFISTQVTKLAAKEYRVTGDLTLHGVTKPVTAEVTLVGQASDPSGGGRCGFDVSFAIQRSDFGMSEMVGPVSDEVSLMIGLEGARE